MLEPVRYSQKLRYVCEYAGDIIFGKSSADFHATANFLQNQ